MFLIHHKVQMVLQLYLIAMCTGRIEIKSWAMSKSAEPSNFRHITILKERGLPFYPEQNQLLPGLFLDGHKSWKNGNNNNCRVCVDTSTCRMRSRNDVYNALSVATLKTLSVLSDVPTCGLEPSPYRCSLRSFCSTERHVLTWTFLLPKKRFGSYWVSDFK